MSLSLHKVVEAAKLYAKGRSTNDVASQTGVCRQTLLRWRKDEHSPAAQIMRQYPVPALRPKKPTQDYVVFELPTDDNFRKFYDKFYPDWKIAFWMGQSEEVVESWRNANRLPAWIDPQDIGVETLNVENKHERAKIKAKLIHHYLQKALKSKAGWPSFESMLHRVAYRVTEQRLAVSPEQVRAFYRRHYRSRGWVCPRRTDKSYIPLGNPHSQLKPKGAKDK